MSDRRHPIGFFVKPAYRTKTGKPQLAIYVQAPPRRGENGELLTVRAMPLLLASNALDDPERFLGIVAEILNAVISEEDGC
ncbi:hypothetical protein [Paracoccus aestuariivivens]|uniref:Uncharacterized protein n=1 Tax=Paracoccus aestuariivivens TaxID=1820333 RepID=A0A6L6JHT7_9RHOB|nr:hypothetical protein [Paracoccus aestuariivivens]MTH79451.1 hypothetical protein [Paracoccus aestuariivivens]